MRDAGARLAKLRHCLRWLCSTLELLYQSDLPFPKRRDLKVVKDAPHWRSHSGQEPRQGLIPVTYGSHEEAGRNAAIVSAPR
jgi:hypothetical protein